MAPAGTPRPIIERLNAEVANAIKLPHVRASLEDMGGDVRGSTPEEMKSLVATELARWSRIVSERNIPKSE